MEHTRGNNEDPVLEVLYRDYELIDVRTRLNPQETKNQQFITSLLQENPALYFFLNCELRIANIINQVLREEKDELHRELERVIEDREEHRKLWDLVQQTRQGLSRALGSLHQDEELKRRLLQGIRNAFEKRRDHAYEILKKILLEKHQRTRESEQQRKIKGQLHLIAAIQWFHRGRAFAQKAHHRARQVRGSGEAYINHPLRVASQLLLAARKNLSEPRIEPDPRQLVWCGHNHDVAEDTPVTLEEIEEEAFLAYLQFEFYRKERKLVEKEAAEFARKTRAVIELDSEDKKLKTMPKGKRERIMMKRLDRARPLDIRWHAILVKLSDRIDNTLTLAGMGEPEKMRRKLRSTVEWCEFILHDDDLNDLGLAEYFVEVTRDAYGNFEEKHGDFMQDKDRTNITWLDDNTPSIRRRQPFIPKIYETVSNPDLDEEVRITFAAKLDDEEIEELYERRDPRI